MNILKTIGFSLSVLLSQLANATSCENIEFITRSGHFVSINPETLKLQSVADMKWHGIFDVNYASRSELSGFLNVNADRTYDFDLQKFKFDNTKLVTHSPDKETSSPGPILEIQTSSDSDNSFWIDNSDVLAQFSISDKQDSLLILHDISKGSRKEYSGREFTPSDNSHGCRKGESVFITGKKGILELSNQDSKVNSYPDSLLKTKRYVVDGNGCNVMFQLDRPSKSGLAKFVVLDIHTLSISPVFESSVYSEYRVFSDGKSVMEGRMSVETLSQDPPAIKMSALSDFRLIDLTQTEPAIVSFESLNKSEPGALQGVLCGKHGNKAVFVNQKTLSVFDISAQRLGQTDILDEDGLMLLH